SSEGAWARRKERQVCWLARCGAGGKPERRRTRRIVAAATRWPSRRSSPWILTYPQVGFSVASDGGRDKLPIGGHLRRNLWPRVSPGMARYLPARSDRFPLGKS